MKNFIQTLKEKKMLSFTIAILFMLISVILSFGTYNYEKGGFFGHFKSTEHLTLAPTLITTMVAILIYSATIIRNFKKYYSNIPKFIISIINILFLAGFLSVFFIDKATIFGLDTRAILVAGVLLSWLGIRTISGYIWIILVLLGASRMSDVDAAMKGWGVIYILCAYLSIVVQAVFCKMFETDFETFKEDLFGIKDIANKDVKAASEQVKSTVEAVSKLVK